MNQEKVGKFISQCRKEKAERNLISAQSEKKALKKKTTLFKGIVLCFVALLVAAWIIDKIPFSQKIDQTVAAVIYKDGAIIGETSVYMNGNKTRYLFREDSFVGEFRVFSVEQINVDDLQTKIRWFRDQEMQRMSHFYKGDFSAPTERGLVHYLVISKDMKDFAIITTQHEIIATSVKAYKLCSEYIVYNDDGTITVNGGWFLQ